MVGVLLAACFSLLMGGTNGTVLCLGKNGHIAIEPSQHAPCSGSDPGVHSADAPVHKPLQSAYVSSNYRSCIDFFLADNHSYLTPASAQKKISSRPAKCVSTHQRNTLSSNTPQRMRPMLPPASEHAGLSMLPTIVLLI